MSNPRVEDLGRNADNQFEQYIKSLRLLHEVQATPGTPRRPASNEWPASPATFLRSNTFALSPAIEQRTRRATNESPRSRPFLLQDSDQEGSFLPLTPPSVTPARNAETLPSSVLKPLKKNTFSEDDLVKHIKSIPESSTDTVAALADVIQKRDDLDTSNILSCFEHGKESYYKNATYQFYEVDSAGATEQKLTIHAGAGETDPDNRDTSVWSVLRQVNVTGNSVGRISILQEPSPLILAATHLTMSAHFDMDELLAHLVSTTNNKGKTRAYTLLRSIELEPLRQRSFFFVFKYYTIVGEDLQPAPWQPFDPRPPDRKSPDHIDITECSSVLALSLGGDPIESTEVIVKRKKRTGVMYDTFAPWQLLNIQYCADDNHSSRSEFEKKVFRNGPHAFLDALCVEYRDAVKRYMGLNEMITKLITPPNQFMFDVRLRDKLLFEDSHFTYSRRYFWAYNTLGVINEGIRSMSTAYLTTFTKDFWAGKHPTLWPIHDPNSLDPEYLQIMDSLRQDLESVVAELKLMYDKNEATRTEIRSLREQLFSGSSVKESRRAIEQGDNIKILTSVSMIFLPLTFVVSIFSITTIDIEISDPRFVITVVSVCIPFFGLIMILQTRASMVLVRKIGRAVNRLFDFLPSLSYHGGHSGAGAGATGGLDRRGNYHYYGHGTSAGLGISSAGTGTSSSGGLRRMQQNGVLQESSSNTRNKKGSWFASYNGMKWLRWDKRKRVKGDEVSKMEEGEGPGPSGYEHEHVR
ncbi:hypothetical protein QBC43DRAFT_332267 [Cladorrhinum sp. PSN259]|nr:hypothetical protein QBC43DRAFT_332267 [Cladorrhinum sp. PSN259]